MEYRNFYIFEKNGAYTVGSWNNDSFDDCTLENLSTHIDEEALVKWCINNAVNLQFYDFRSHTEKTLEEYRAHFIEYDPDESFIVPIAIFDSIEKAKQFIDFLED